jgi:glyoxylase-like metal-dependent hydrolase (beta-lactamase superfamily II)
MLHGPPTAFEDLGHGITAIDTNYVRPRFDASHLVVENGRAAFVDVNTGHSVGVLLAGLEAKNLTPEAVNYVILTHVHLDHAGGAGEIMRRLPQARLVVHPRGTRHMTDPSKLWAGASAVFGEEAMLRNYGAPVPVDASRIIEAPEGFTLELGGRPLLFLDTPGHARHHFCVWDEASRSMFTGDTFGLSYRELASERARPSSCPRRRRCSSSGGAPRVDRPAGESRAGGDAPHATPASSRSSGWPPTSVGRPGSWSPSAAPRMASPTARRACGEASWSCSSAGCATTARRFPESGSGSCWPWTSS